MNKSESKYFNTAAKMDVAFLELLNEKDFAYITVKEICKRAGVSRSTFYLHYETVNDLVRECVEYLHNRFLTSFDGQTLPQVDNLSDYPMSELYFITPEYLVPYLTFIKASATLFRVALAQADVLDMRASYERLFTHVFSPILYRFQVDASEQRYLMTFYIHGLIAIVNEWLAGGCKESIETIATIMRSRIPDADM